MLSMAEEKKQEFCEKSYTSVVKKVGSGVRLTVFRSLLQSMILGKLPNFPKYLLVQL